MTRTDVVLVLLLAIGLAEAGALAWRARTTPVVLVPVLQAGDPADMLHAPGGPERLLAAHVAQIGDHVTVEDLARGALALLDGGLDGVPPLTDAERARLAPLVAQTRQDRDALLASSAALADIDAQLDARALEIVRTLTDEQLAWIHAHRDDVSVAGVEDAYWAALQQRTAP